MVTFSNQPIEIILPFGPRGFSCRAGIVLQQHLAEFLETAVKFKYFLKYR